MNLNDADVTRESGGRIGQWRLNRAPLGAEVRMAARGRHAARAPWVASLEQPANSRVPPLASTLLAVGLAAALWLCACGRTDQSDAFPADAVAMVGSQVITMEVFENELARRTRLVPGRDVDPRYKQALLEEMVRSEVLYQKALAAGYDKDPQVAASLRQMITTRYQEDQLAKLGQFKANPADIADYYRRNPQRFGTLEKVRVALIELKAPRTATAAKRAEVAANAEAILAEAKAAAATDGTFGLLAQKHSEDQASRYRGGDIGWLTVGETNGPRDAAVLAAISQLTQPGDFAPVVETPAAFYLLKLVERRPASMRPLEEVKDGIAYLVGRQKAQQQEQALYDVLKQGLKIRTNHALLETIRLPTNEGRPPGAAGALSAGARTP